MKRSPRHQRLLRDFGRRLRALREVTGYHCAEDLAEDLGIEAPRYRKYERGESLPPLDVLADIRKIGDKSLDWLLLGRRNPSSDNE